jgi:tetratricopeptide (TPR) repeat protein/S1-C subfamily serine protease
MPKYLTFLPILLLTLGTISPIAIAQSQPETRIDRSTAPTPKYTGVVKQVDDIAQQITVRIDTVDDEKKQDNGSGVIVAREGNTYSVVTAAHVFKDKQGYSIITPTQERIKVRAEQVTILNKDLDIALVKFTSSQNYRVAELANYQFKDIDWVFVSGFSGRDATRSRSLSTGMIMSRDSTEFTAQRKESLSNGNSLIYTNLSLPGMSGGGVLDREGRLVGINTGAENKQIINQDNYQQDQINFGYALGISVPTILGSFNRGKISTAQLKIVTSIPSKIANSDLVAIVSYLLSQLVPPNQTSTTKEWLDYGNLLWRSAQNDRAIIAFDRVISILKNTNTSSDRELITIAYFGKGMILLSSGNNKEAVSAFRAASNIDPKFIQAWRYQGMILTGLKEYPEALNSYEKAIDLDKDNFTLYVEKGDILNNLKRYPESIDSFSRAIQIQPNHPWAYNNRGSLYDDLKQYAQAIADLNKAIELSPQLAEGYYNRGKTYKNMTQYQQALLDYDKAIELNPKYIDAYVNRGNIYRDQTQYQKALIEYNKAIELKPEGAVPYTNRAYNYGYLRQFNEAKADIKKATQLFRQQGDSAGYQEMVAFMKKTAQLLKQTDPAGYQTVMEILKELGE